MRHAVVPFLAVALAAPAFAQDDVAEEEDFGAAISDDEASFGGDDVEADMRAERRGKSTSTAPESYIVRPGDTLWTLSQRFLNNPWYWPKVWSYNQQLDNPNWIYPGTQIRFYPGSDTPVADPIDDEPRFDDLKGGQFEGDGIGDRFSDVGTDRRHREFFVPKEKLDEAGQVQNSPEEKQLLTTEDRAYIKLNKQHKPGEVLQMFRPTREVRHPITGANLGQLVMLVGEVRVDQLSKEQALGTITAAWDTLERGDYVAQLPTETDVITRVENSKELKGYVVNTGARELSYVGTNYVVLLDKGESDGVQIGNSFTIVRAGDPFTRQYSGMADEDIGEVLIIETAKQVSTGLLMKASREVVPGDRVVMRTARR